VVKPELIHQSWFVKPQLPKLVHQAWFSRAWSTRSGANQSLSTEPV